MSTKSFTISLIILLATIASVAAIASRGETVVVATNLENLPMEIAGFKATEDFFPDSVYKELDADKHVYRHYRSEDGRQVDLYVGYYGTAKGGRTGHNPYACLPGAGWGIVEARKVQLTAHSLLNITRMMFRSTMYWHVKATHMRPCFTGINLIRTRSLPQASNRIYSVSWEGSYIIVTMEPLFEYPLFQERTTKKRLNR